MVQVRAHTSDHGDGTCEAWSGMVGAVWQRVGIGGSRRRDSSMDISDSCWLLNSSASGLVADRLAWVTFFFVVCGLWVLWSEAGTGGGHQLGRRHWLFCWLGGEKLMWGWGVYMNCRGWFRLFKISWGKNLKGIVIFGWLALLMVLLSNGCLWLCCICRKSALIPKLT